MNVSTKSFGSNFTLHFRFLFEISLTEMTICFKSDFITVFFAPSDFVLTMFPDLNVNVIIIKSKSYDIIN